jgi:hypothetical protein
MAKACGYKKEEKVLPNNHGLNMPIRNMSSRIEQLKNDRPTELTPLRKNINNGTTDMRGKYMLRSRISWTGLYGKKPWQGRGRCGRRFEETGLNYHAVIH